jgi:D-arabinono-1,4-lactone oxidase
MRCSNKYSRSVGCLRSLEDRRKRRGIITEGVTLSLTPAFKVTGTQQTSPIQPFNPDWTLGCPVNLFGTEMQGVPGVEEYFKDPNNEYMCMVSNL